MAAESSSSPLQDAGDLADIVAAGYDNRHAMLKRHPQTNVPALGTHAHSMIEQRLTHFI
jgi:hypothetical protein